MGLGNVCGKKRRAGSGQRRLFALVSAVALTCCTAAGAQAAAVQPVTVDRACTCCYQDANYELRLQMPKLTDPAGGSGAEEINEAIRKTVKKQACEFGKQYLQEKGQGHRFLAVSYQPVINTERWFALKLETNEIEASSFVSYRFYNIDRTTGKWVCLRDLFTDKHFGKRIEQELQAQAEKLPEGKNITVPTIDGSHNFYLDAQGQLVIPFDQYEAGPGSLGSFQLAIPLTALKDILKPQYRP